MGLNGKLILGSIVEDETRAGMKRLPTAWRSRGIKKSCCSP